LLTTRHRCNLDVWPWRNTAK